MTRLAELYRVDHFIDTFALGHYARVLGALDRRTGKNVAFKILRPEHLTHGSEMRWEYRAFGHEAQLLMKLVDIPHVVDLYDCGFISSGSQAPADGEIVSFRLDVAGFKQSLAEFAEQGWRPYLTLENLPRSNNLFYLMKPTHPNVRWRLPTEEGLALSLQFANMLRFAHQQGIVYLDFKLEHVYWDGNQLRVIDLNSSKQLNGNIGDQQQFRMDVHNLCVGVLYSIFTGMSPQKTTLRPQPSSIDEVESRYKDVTELDFNMEPTLSMDLRDLLQRGAAMELESIDEFIVELHKVAAQYGWDFPEHYTSPSSRDARTQMKAGLKRLREGQSQIREARDLFREAIIQEGISEDLEDELRRIVKSINEMLTRRVIP